MTFSNSNTEFVLITGASEHNLKNIELKIPKRKLVVFSGVSGSGKSSLAFDTIYAEGRRRYVESLSAYARQFLGQMEKPKYDAIRGLAPTIAIEQKKATSNPRSTVGTITEISDYLRVFYARCGEQHCHICGKPAGKTSPEEIINSICDKFQGQRITILAPILANRKGEFKDVVSAIQAQGFLRVQLNGEIVRIEGLEISKKHKNTLDVVIDRLKVSNEDVSRLSEGIETALKVGENWVKILTEGQETVFSTEHACADCNIGLPEPSPQLFSFNNPTGMCKTCEGLGRRLVGDPLKIVPDPSLSIMEGAVVPWKSLLDKESMSKQYISSIAKEMNFSLNTPWKDLPKKIRDTLLFGSKQKIKITIKHSSGEWVSTRPIEGVVNRQARLYKETQSSGTRSHYQKFMSEKPCNECNGSRLRAEARAFTINGVNIADISSMTVGDAYKYFDALRLSGNKEIVGTELVKEIKNRLLFLLNVGLEYLALDRQGSTLSGGEAQRIRLASQLGSELSGVIYVLDEPSIGLHSRDNGRLLATLARLRDLGNTVIVVEHDRETIESADWVVEFGPGAGILGGEIVFSGTPSDLLHSETITGEYLSGRKSINPPLYSRLITDERILLEGCCKNNLKNINVKIPTGAFTTITGVSGAGKSSLVNDTLLPALKTILSKGRVSKAIAKKITVPATIDKVIAITQDPIGRTPRSNPSTYTKMFDHIRTIFSKTKEAVIRGFRKGRFSFNVRGGRCEACQGNGFIKVEMHFLADVYVPCEICKGKRFNRETLTVRYKGLNISEVLNLTVDEAYELFDVYRPLKRILGTLKRVGLGYVKLGQPSTTLSGGEAQRIKLAKELARPATGHTLYVLDEPTTGLHFDNIRMLIDVLQELVERGNTIVVIEHNLDVIKCADWIIDLGPEGGENGGNIVATGRLKEICREEKSWTGKHLKPVLEAMEQD